MLCRAVPCGVECRGICRSLHWQPAARSHWQTTLIKMPAASQMSTTIHIHTSAIHQVLATHLLVHTCMHPRSRLPASTRAANPPPVSWPPQHSPHRRTRAQTSANFPTHSLATNISSHTHGSWGIPDLPMHPQYCPCTHTHSTTQLPIHLRELHTSPATTLSLHDTRTSCAQRTRSFTARHAGVTCPWQSRCITERSKWGLSRGTYAGTSF